MKCSIIIRAYNEAKYLGRLLEGIKHQTLKDVEVILVDSGSTDSTIEIAESYRARVLHIPSEEFTFGRSLNYGVREATCEYLIIASAHVYPVYPDWLASLLHPLLDEQVALSYGADDLDGTVQEERIYHMAGSRTPEALSTDDIRRLILAAGRDPVERDTLYNPIGPEPVLIH